MNSSYDFIFEHLDRNRIEVKKMFGHQCLYYDGLMVMFLIDKPDNPDNGVCLATSAEHIENLRKDIKSIRHLEAYGATATNWRLIPADSESFEADVELACGLIKKKDPRVGREPTSKRRIKPAVKRSPSNAKKKSKQAKRARG